MSTSVLIGTYTRQVTDMLELTPATKEDAAAIFEGRQRPELKLVTDAPPKPDTPAKEKATTEVACLEPPKEKALERPNEVKAQPGTNRVQDLLLKEMPNYLIVKRKEGQSEEDALKEARAARQNLLEKLKDERDRGVVGEATLEAFRQFQTINAERALKASRSVSVTFEAACTDSGFEKLLQQAKNCTEARRRANELQDQLIDFLPAYANVPKDPDKTYPDRLKAEVRKRAEELKMEKEQGIWGPRSQEAYKLYQKWYYEAALPGAMAELDSLACEWPVDCPLKLQTGIGGKAEAPMVFRDLAAAGKRIQKVDVNPADALESDAYRLFQKNNKWLRDAAQTSGDAGTALQVKFLKDYIAEQKLPEGWLRGADEDPKKWVVAVTELIDESERIRNLLEAMDHLHRTSKDKSFPFDPPPGTVFERDQNGEIARNPDGTIKSYTLALPESANLNDPVVWEQYQKLLRWSAAYHDRVVEAITAHQGALASPENFLAFTNIEMHGKLAVIDQNGKFVGITAPGQPVPAGLRTEPFNLIEARCRVKVATEGEHKGKKVLVQSCEARQIPTLGYQNWVGPTVAKTEREILLDAKKFYPILVGNKVELCRGDQVEGILSRQKFWLRFEQVVTPAVDIGLILLTAGEGFALYKGTQVAAQTGLKLTAGEFWRGLAVTGFRFTMAGAGILNSAGGRDFAAGRVINHTRNIYFLCDIGLGLSRTAGLIGTSERVSKMQEIVKQCGWLRALDKTSTGVFKASEYCFVPFIARDLKGIHDKQLGKNKRNLVNDADFILGDGRQLQLPQKDSFDMAKRPEVLAQEREILDRYIKMLSTGQNPQKTKEILEKTKALLDPKTTPQEREKFKKELLDYFLLDKSSLERLVRLRMSNADLRELHDPALLLKKWADIGAADKMNKRLAEVGPDVRAAAAIALLTLSRNADGSVPTELVSDTRTFTLSRGRNGTTTTATYTVGISKEELFGYLKRDLALPDQHSRGIAAGEALVRYGGMNGQQYASVLVRVLQDPKSTREERMRALSDPLFPRLATIIDGLKTIESVGAYGVSTNRPDWAGFSVSAKNFEDVLRKTAQQDADEDVRAMATMLLYGLNHPDRAEAQSILQENNARWQANAEAPKGTYAREARQFLEAKCAEELPPPAPGGADAATAKEAEAKANLAREARLNAALQLWQLSDKKNVDEQKKIARLIASCWSDTDASVSNKVIQALWPDRVKLLEKHEVSALQEKAVNLVSVPQVKEGTLVVGQEEEKQARAASALIRQLAVILQDNAEQSKRLCAKLENMLDPRGVATGQEPPDLWDAIKHTVKPAGCLPEAKLFPEMKVEAIRCLVALRSQSSVPLIRACLTGEISFEGKGDVKKFPVDTSNPQVRIEAAKALYRLRDDKLCDILPDLIAREFDPAVAQVLRDAQLEFPPRKAPDRKEIAQDKFEKAVHDYARPKPPDLNVGKDYLNQDRYKYLDVAKYRSAVEAAHDRYKDPGWSTNLLLGARPAYQALTDKCRLEDVGKIRDEREAQFKSLVAMAAKSDAATNGEAGKAKAALAWILHTEGVGTDFCISAPYDPQKRSIPGSGLMDGAGRQWRERAAREIVDILLTGEDKQKTAFIIEGALKDPNIDTQTKRILLGGLRWMLQESNKLIENLGPGSGQSKQHQHLLGFDRAHLVKVLGDILATEREQSNRLTGPPFTDRANLRKEIIAEFAQFASRDELYPILLASALHDPSDNVKALARQKLLEMRDGIEPRWAKVPESKIVDVQGGTVRAAEAYEAWKAVRVQWMAYTAAFDKDPGTAVWKPEVFDKRETLVNTLFTAFKGCKFDARERNADPKIIQAEAEALAFLTRVMDDPDPHVRLAAARIISESSLSFAASARQKALLVNLDLIDSKNPEYKKEAEAQLARFRFDKSPDQLVDLLDNLNLADLRTVARVLEGMSRSHPDKETKDKALDLNGKLWQRLLRGIIEGKRTLNPEELSANDQIMPLLQKAIVNKALTEEERLNAARVWFLADHARMPQDEYKQTFDALVELTASKEAKVREAAIEIMARTAQAERRHTPPMTDVGWGFGVQRQMIVVAALTKIDHPAAREAVKLAASHPEIQIQRIAQPVYTADTVKDINKVLNGNLDDSTRITFDAITSAEDPRILSILVHDAAKNKVDRVAQLYALVARESTGVGHPYKFMAVRELVTLIDSEDAEVSKRALWVLKNLDPAISGDAVTFLSLSAASQICSIKGDAPTAQEKERIERHLNCILALCSRNADDKTLQGILMILQRTAPKLHAEFPQLNELADVVAASFAERPIRSASDSRLSFALCDHPVVQLAAAKAILAADPAICKKEERSHALRALASVTVNGDEKEAGEALAILRGLKGSDAELAADHLRAVAFILERRPNPDQQKIVATLKLVEELLKNAGVDAKDDRMLSAVLHRKEKEGKTDRKELDALQDEIFDRRYQKSKNPSAFYSDRAFDRCFDDLKEAEKKYGAGSLEAAHAQLALAKVAYCNSQRYTANDTVRDNQRRSALYNAEQAVEVFRKKASADSPELCDALYWLGNAEMNAGKFAEAEKHFKEAFEIYRKQSGKIDGLDGIWIARQLSEAMILNGNIADAAGVAKELLKISDGNLDMQKSKEVLSVLKTLIPLFSNPPSGKGPPNYPVAEELIRRALTLSKKLHGESSLDVARMTAKLATNLGNCQNRDTEALPLFEAAIKIYRQCPNATKQELEEVLSSYGTCLHQLKRNDEAQKVWKEASLIKQEIDREEAREKQNLFRRIKGDGTCAPLKAEEVAQLKQSVEKSEAAIDEADRKFGARSVEAGKVRLAHAKLLFALALNCDDAGTMSSLSHRAFRYAKSGQMILKETLPHGHIDLLDANYQLAMTQMINQEDSLPTMLDVMAICQKNPGAVKSGDMVWIYNRLILSSMAARDLAQMDKSVQDLIAFLQVKPTASDKGDVCEALKQLALALTNPHNTGGTPRLDAAEKLLKAALELSLEKHGSDSAKTASLYLTLAEVHADQGKHADALVGFAKALAILDKIEVVDAAELMQLLEMYAISLKQCGKDREALKVMQRLQDVRRKAAPAR